MPRGVSYYQHLDLWNVKPKPPPCANDPPPETIIIYDKLTSPSADDYLIDANYPIEKGFLGTDFRGRGILEDVHWNIG